MNRCLNCKRRLTLLNWRPVCPHCGVNLTFFHFEERFLADAKNTELGFAKVRVLTARLKSAYIGSPLAIARLLICLLPVAAFLLPFSNQVFHLPMADESYSLGILGIVALVQRSALPYLLQLAGSAVVGDVFSSLLYALVGFAATILCAALVVLMTVLCFLSVKKCAAAACGFSVLGIAAAVVTMFLSGSFVSTAAARMPGVVSAANDFGGLAVIAAFAAAIVVNLLFLWQGLTIKYAPGDLERVEIAKKIKRGELTLEELPFPIFETEEERAVRLAEEAEAAVAQARRAEKRAREAPERGADEQVPAGVGAEGGNG